MHIVNNSRCVFCQNAVESVQHFLISCRDLCELRLYVEEKLDGFVNRGLCLSDFTYLTFTDFGLSDFNVILISEYLYTIWIVRKEVLFDGKTFDRTSLLLTFKQRLRNRIHADFRRLNRSSFIILWFNRQLAVNIIDGKLSLSF